MSVGGSGGSSGAGSSSSGWSSGAGPSSSAGPSRVARPAANAKAPSTATSASATSAAPSKKAAGKAAVKRGPPQSSHEELTPADIAFLAEIGASSYDDIPIAEASPSAYERELIATYGALDGTLDRSGRAPPPQPEREWEAARPQKRAGRRAAPDPGVALEHLAAMSSEQSEQLLSHRGKTARKQRGCDEARSDETALIPDEDWQSTDDSVGFSTEDKGAADDGSTLEGDKAERAGARRRPATGRARAPEAKPAADRPARGCRVIKELSNASLDEPRSGAAAAMLASLDVEAVLRSLWTTTTSAATSTAFRVAHGAKAGLHVVHESVVAHTPRTATFLDARAAEPRLHLAIGVLLAFALCAVARLASTAHLDGPLTRWAEIPAALLLALHFPAIAGHAVAICTPAPAPGRAATRHGS
jgi:hypothetical protein